MFPSQRFSSVWWVWTGLTVDGINGGPSFLVAFWLWACRLGIFLGLGARCLGCLSFLVVFLWVLGAAEGGLVAVDGFGGVVHSSGGGDVPVAGSCGLVTGVAEVFLVAM